MSRRSRIILRLTATIGVVWAVYLLRAGVWFRLYPAAMVAVALAFFALSLRRTPLVETFARRMGETLDERGVAYCRRVTVAWTVFLSVHFAVTLATVFASHEVWAIYTGVLAYVLIGAMFAGEWLVRRRVRRG